MGWAGRKTGPAGGQEAAHTPQDPLLLSVSSKLPGSLWGKGSGFYWRRRGLLVGELCPTPGLGDPEDLLVEMYWARPGHVFREVGRDPPQSPQPRFCHRPVLKAPCGDPAKRRR